jgi:hypothetical protein
MKSRFRDNSGPFASAIVMLRMEMPQVVSQMAKLPSHWLENQVGSIT